MTGKMRSKLHLMMGFIVVIAIFAMLASWQDHAQRSAKPDVQAVATRPLSELVGARQPLPAKGQVVQVERQVNRDQKPHTGGAQLPQYTNAAVAIAAPPKQISPPKPAAPVQQNEPSRQDGAVQAIERAPANDRVTERQPVSAAVTPEAQPTAQAAKPPEDPVPETNQTAADDRAAKVPTPERPPSQQASAMGMSMTSMQPGVATPGGQQAPALWLAVSGPEIEALLATNKAIVVVVDEVGKEPYFLAHPERDFRPFKQLAVAVSERYVDITDPGLKAQWRIRLSLFSGSPKFGLRFTQTFDKAVLERQFASLTANNINFEQALAEGWIVITHGRVDLDSATVTIDRVSVQKPPRAVTEEMRH